MLKQLRRLLHPSFARGVHPEAHKETAQQPIRRLPFPTKVIVPLAQHFGAAARPLVRKGQEVVRGEPIAEAVGFFSVPHHAPVTGEVESIGLTPTARGPKTEAISLRTYAGSAQRVLWGQGCDLDELSPQRLIERIQECGMVGLGGAGFPTHVKLSVPEGHPIDTLLINGCECEPYLTTDHRLMLEQPEALLAGIRLVMRAIGAQRGLIGVEDNKCDAIDALQAALTPGDSIRVAPVATKYPQGSEKLLIQVLLGREVPSGGFPYEVGVVVQNVATLAQLGSLLPLRQGLIERVVTVAGPAIARPGNYLMPLGTPLRFLLEQVGFDGRAEQIILGGPMMGSTVASLDVPITKTVSGVLALGDAINGQRKASENRIYPCIRCGHCVDACPIGLNPSQLGLLAASRAYPEMAEQYHLNDCFECGCCSFVCPSNIPLVQYFRIAKSINRERAA